MTASNAGSASREPLVRKNLELVKGQTGIVDDLLEDLATRLVPVTGKPEKTAEPATNRKDAPREITCAIADDLKGVEDRLLSISMRLKDILSRLEI